jgi:hypothetical protein
MKKILAIFTFLLVSSCASLPEYEKKTYVKIGNTDPYSLKQTIDLNNVFKMDNFDAEEDKTKLLRVSVGGVDTFVTRQPYTEEDIFLEKVSSNDEDFLGLAEACSQKAAFEKVDDWALQTGLLATSATIGAASAVAGASTTAAAASATAVAGPLILLTTAVGFGVNYVQDQRSEAVKRAIVMYGCLAENGYQAEPKTI